MKKLLLILLALALQSGVSAQVWVDSGAVWHYDFQFVGGMGFMKYEYAGDTTIQNRECQEITGTMFVFGTMNDSLFLTQEVQLPANYTYVSGDTVFYLRNDKFFVLYNFGASVGDQWTISETNDGFPECGDTSRIVVTGKGTMDVNGSDYRYITVEPTPNSSVGFEGTYVERFGNIDQESLPFHYLFPEGYQCDSLQGIVEWSFIRFKCFEDDSFPQYNPSGEDCEYYLSLLGTEEHQRHRITCRPNPATEMIHIDHDFKTNVQAQVFSSSGGLIKTQAWKHGESVAMDVSDLPPGLYLVRLRTETEGAFTVKFVKE